MITLYQRAQAALINKDYQECKRLMREDNIDYVVVNGHDVFMLMSWDSVHHTDVFTICTNDEQQKKNTF